MIHKQIKTAAVIGTLTSAILLCGIIQSAGAEIIQGTGENYIAFEAESYTTSGTDTYQDTPVSWSKNTDTNASSQAAMVAYVSNSDDLTNDNTAYLSYTLTFKTPGTYTMYARLLAETANSNSGYQALAFDADPLGNNFGFIGTTAAGYVWLPQNGGSSFVITQANQTVTFSVKIREKDFAFDRFVFSLESDLTEVSLDSLTNSEIPAPEPTGDIVQGTNDNYIAFEAESYSTNGVDTYLDNPVSWSENSDTNASGNAAMFAYVGNADDMTPDNDAHLTYSLTFRTPGTYTMYARILAETANSNSGYQSLAFDTDPLGSDFGFIGTTAIGYVWLPQNSSASFITTEVNQTVTFSVKVREREFAFDRFVFSLESSLTETELDDLSNSPYTTAPEPLVIGEVNIALSETNVILGWQGTVSATYAIQRSPNLATNSWSNVVENIAGTDSMLYSTNATTEPTAFYRVVGE